jgi:hypothetical protein
MVRDAICRTPRFAEELKVFSAAEVAREIPEFEALVASYGNEKKLAEKVIEELGAFVRSGMIDRVSQQGNSNRFRYVTAEEAAKRQGPVERSRGGGVGADVEWVDRRNGRGPVAGTGKPERSSNAEVNKLLDDVKAVGVVVEGRRGNHIILKNPATGATCGIASTPSKSGLRDDRAKVRRVLQVPI